MSDLKERVQQFQALELPGQPQMMHVGSSNLVQDLWSEIERLQAALALSQSQNYCTLCGALNPDKNSRALKVKL